MPQITSCPECSKKLRVPDDLIGKKVKCPGCTTLFVAESDDPDLDEAPAPPPPVPPRRRPPDAVTSGPKRPAPERDPERPRARRDEDDEDDRPRARRDEGDDDRPRARRDEGARRPPSRRDDEDDDRRPRRDDSGDRRIRSRRDEDDDRRPRRDDEEDDRRPRSRRDEEDDYDDDRRSSRRRDDEDEPSPRQQAVGWRKVRMGINFVVISGWIGLSIFGVYMVVGGVMLLFGGTAITALLSGNFQGGAGGMGGMVVGMCVLGILVGLLGLTSTVLLLTGTGMCMAVPKFYGSSMRGLAIASFSCYAAFIVLYFFGIIGGQISIGMALVGGLMQIAGMLAGFVGHLLWLILLRSICHHFYDQSLGKTVLTNLIVQIVYPFITFLVLLIVGVIVGVSMAGSTTPGGAAASFGVGMIIGGIVYLFMILIGLGIFVWYLQTMQKVRDLVEHQLDRL